MCRQRLAAAGLLCGASLLSTAGALCTSFNAVKNLETEIKTEKTYDFLTGDETGEESKVVWKANEKVILNGMASLVFLACAIGTGKAGVKFFKRGERHRKGQNKYAPAAPETI